MLCSHLGPNQLNSKQCFSHDLCTHLNQPKCLSVHYSVPTVNLYCTLAQCPAFGGMESSLGGSLASLARHRDQLQNPRKLHNSGNMARRNKRHKIAFLYFPILNKFFDFYSFMPYFPIHRIYGNFYVGRGAIQAGQTVTKAGHHATPGWTLCQDK